MIEKVLQGINVSGVSNFFRGHIRELFLECFLGTFATRFVALRLDHSGDERTPQRHGRSRVQLAVAIAEAPAVGAIPSGRSSRATGKETVTAIAGTEFRFPEDLSELLRTVHRILRNDTKAFHKCL